MALIKCPECGKEVSDKANVCVSCGFPLYNMNFKHTKAETSKHTWITMRKAFGIVDLVLCLLLILLAIAINDGFFIYSRIVGTCWFLACSGILNTFWSSGKWSTIISMVFYFFGVLYNLISAFETEVYLLIVVMSINFLAFNLISLKKMNQIGKFRSSAKSHS